jgi:hypothetical protein
MAKNHNHKKKHKPRNAAAGLAHSNAARPSTVSRPRRPRVRRGDKPSFWTATSAIAGGVGGAALNGWAARQGYDPRWVGAAIAGIGGLGAWKLDGNLRLASYGLAASGAGASVLEWLDKDEDKPTAKKQLPAAKDADKEAIADAKENVPGGMRQARSGGGLDRAFNKVRDRLHRIYEDEDDDAFVEHDAT